MHAFARQLLLRGVRPLARTPITNIAACQNPARLLCSSSDNNKKWDGQTAVHGTPKQTYTSVGVPEAEDATAKPKTPREKSDRFGFWTQQQQQAANMGRVARGGGDGGYNPNAPISAEDKADMVKFHVYVRQRLGELNQRMPPKMSTRERAELAFLEEQVAQDAMPMRKRRIRDPLRTETNREIRHTNLPLLSRFVSEAGNILPKRLTGVAPSKQRRLTRAIKRAQVLALMPRTWKLPRYRHASYADQYSLPERPPPNRLEDDEFRDPPDIRFPNQWDDRRGPHSMDITRLIRPSPGMAPRPAANTDAAAEKPSGGKVPTWPAKR